MRYNRIFLFFLALSLMLGGCQRTKAAEEQGKNDFLDNVSFLGDSITAHMTSRAKVSPAQVWATKERYLNLDSRITYARIIAPDTGEEERIADVAARLNPPYLVITLGVDYGVYYFRNEPQTLVKHYERLLDEIAQASPQTQILVQSILPVTAACKSITNAMIDTANAALREMSVRRDIPYLDTQSVLRDENGFLRAEYCFSEDGIHLNARAYEAMLAYIRTQASERGWSL